jgi:APA family basic amino acid/polyamine antiporter
MVYLKVVISVVFVIAGVRYIDTAHWHPYIPANTGEFGHFGWSGVMRGAAIIFFSYIGFDTASTTALESRRPQRDVPIGILGALVLSGVLYVAMAAVMTGMVPYAKLDVDQPVAVAIDLHPELGWIGTLVKVGVIAGMTSVVLMSLLGQPRILSQWPMTASCPAHSAIVIRATVRRTSRRSSLAFSPPRSRVCSRSTCSAS